MKRKLPDYLKPYFWDVKFEDLDVLTHGHLVIKRILDRGDSQAVRWLVRQYGLKKIEEVVTKTRDLARPTGNFWADILSISKDRLPCLLKPYSPIHFGLYS